jgi:hypothetical protein
MAERRNSPPPESPTAIGMQTGMDVPGYDNIRGTLEECLVTPPAPITEVVPGQSGAEALGALPSAREDDPWDGP